MMRSTENATARGVPGFCCSVMSRDCQAPLDGSLASGTVSKLNGTGSLCGFAQNCAV